MSCKLRITCCEQKGKALIQWLLLALAALLQFGCANESVPLGGKQDKTPPVAKKMSPENKTTNFKGDKIQITFDEFIKETGFTQTLISPPMEKKPDYKISGKTLTIKLKSPLRDSTTYTINFADDIKDINEGNIADNFTYVFSTGNFIDSQKVSGSVLLAKDNSPTEGAIVSLYPSDSVDGILKFKPLYFGKTDKAGHFQINNVKSDSYHIYALKDQNFNYLYDQPNELIAFSDSIITLNDSTPKTVSLYLFDENNKALKLADTRSVIPGLVQICYTKPITNFKLSGELASPDDFIQQYKTKDTINYWYSKYYVEKATVFLTANDTLIDTARLDLKFIKKDSLLVGFQNILTVVNQANVGKEKAENKKNYTLQDLYQQVKINFTRPITEIRKSESIKIYEDSMKESSNAKFTVDTLTKQFISVDFVKKENTKYTIEIPDSIFRDVLGTHNKKTIYKIKTSSKDGYGNLNITLKTDHPERSYIINVLNSNDEVVKTFELHGNNERKVSAENIPAGNYKFVVIDDENNNGKWDTGNFKNKIQPEKLFTYKDTYQLKGGWDLDVEVKF